MGKLTPKQEKFALKFIECGNASEAYRHAYDAKNMQPESIKVAASRLLANANVTLTIQAAQQKHAERHMVTVDSLTQELEDARLMAFAEKKTSAAVSATLGKAKLHGLITDKVAATLKKSPVSAKDLTDDELAAIIAAGRGGGDAGKAGASD